MAKPSTLSPTPPKQKWTSEFKVALIALISLSFVVYLGKAYETTLRGIDSNIHAKVSMDITSQGFLPHIPIPDPNLQHSDREAYFNDHPFFYFWVNGGVMRALGPNAWSARVLTATFSVGCVLLTLALGSLIHSQLFGFLSALFLLFSRDIILTGATVSLDPALMFFILLSFLAWHHRKWLWIGVIAGIGLWIKTPVVLLIFPTALIISLIEGKLDKEIRPIAQSALLALSVGSLIWIATGLLGGWQLVQDYWIRQVWGTAVGGRQQTSAADPWSFFKMIRTGFLPGLPFLIIGVLRILKKKLWKEPMVILSAIAISIVGIVISLLRFRLDYYFNPIFPFLAFISSYSIIKIVKRIQKGFYLAFTSLSSVLMAFLLTTPTPLGPEPFIALRRFIPLIQSYGNCSDEILLISGGEPVGSQLDYNLVLKFYTGHPVEIEDCASAATQIRNSHPHWIILSEEHLNHCLTAQETSPYKMRFRMGAQYLLTDLIEKGNEVDLSPLERETKPVIDCKPQAYPKDIYHVGFSDRSVDTKNSK